MKIVWYNTKKYFLEKNCMTELKLRYNPYEQKTEYVRNSGKRYIDFYKAVGANADGTWFSGMQASDLVHATESGGKALYLRAIYDFPELIG